MGVWRSGLANSPTSKFPMLAARWTGHDGWYVINWPGPGVTTPGSLVALPDVVVPDLYHYQNAPGSARFPYGYEVNPDH